ncbi:hypothetical protein D3C85_781220 [compost metagenome]
MAYDAKVLPVMIASPSDVLDEREAVRRELAEWNVIYSKTQGAVLLPVGWETHTSPELAGRPQEIINERLLNDADLLVGIFWTRVGSHTGKAISGSVEEIERHMTAGKPVLLYFSEAPVHPASVVKEQFEALQNFKSWAMERGLVESFATPDEFTAKFRRQLPITLRDNAYLQSCLATPTPAVEGHDALPEMGELAQPHLSDDEEKLLQAAAGSDGNVLILRHMGGTIVQAGRKNLAGDGQREAARWIAAVQGLEDAGFLEARGAKGEVFGVTHAGYQFAELQGWPVHN